MLAIVRTWVRFPSPPPIKKGAGMKRGLFLILFSVSSSLNTAIKKPSIKPNDKTPQELLRTALLHTDRKTFENNLNKLPEGNSLNDQIFYIDLVTAAKVGLESAKKSFDQFSNYEKFEPKSKYQNALYLYTYLKGIITSKCSNKSEISPLLKEFIILKSDSK